MRRMCGSMFNRRLFSYEARAVERKWQSVWKRQPEVADASLPKYYVLAMFPYPSGVLHMGHLRVYSISDAIARFQRMQGFSVLHPMGWDSFGLPAENAANERGIEPSTWTESNIAHMRKQLKNIGLSFDWSNEVATHTPAYFKWTQSLFLQLYDKGLAYRKEAAVNWDPVDLTVLANEQVDSDGRSWRSGALVEKKMLRQWFFGITEYADELLAGLKELNWPEQVKKMQSNWIGKSEGTLIKFSETRTVFTTRPDTLPRVSFLAVAGETDELTAETVAHPLAPHVRIPVYRATYVLPQYGTGAVMGVPADDERDKAFARKMGIAPVEIDDTLQPRAMETVTMYRLRDWLVSRQRRWGTPIPVVLCEGCGEVPVAPEELPVVFPPVEQMDQWKQVECPKCAGPAQRETDTMDTFVDSSWYFLRFPDVHNKDSAINEEAVRRWCPVDVYVGGIEHAILHLLYARFINRFLWKQGLVGTPEPFTKLLSQGMVQAETFRDAAGRPVPNKEDSVSATWEKMSKSKLNGIDPDDILDEYGADAARLFILFKAPPPAALRWDDAGIRGQKRWLDRIWDMVEAASKAPENYGNSKDSKLDKSINNAVLQVTRCLSPERLSFNTAVAALMTLSNDLGEAENDPLFREGVEKLVLMLAPMAPHIAAESWALLKNGRDVHAERWPEAEEQKAEITTLTIMINGKKKGQVEWRDKSAVVEDLAAHVLRGKPVKRTVFVKAKGIVNFVV